MAILSDHGVARERKAAELLLEYYRFHMAKTADGKYSDKFCNICWEESHTDAKPCKCLCHTVNEFLYTLEVSPVRMIEEHNREEAKRKYARRREKKEARNAGLEKTSGKSSSVRSNPFAVGSDG